MSKVLKRFYLGDVVKSFGTKQLRKITTEEPVPRQLQHSLIANIPVDGIVTGISKVYDGFIYVTAWNSSTYLTTIYEVDVASGDYTTLYSQVFYESSTKPQNVIKVNGDLYVSFCDTTKTYISSSDSYYVYTHIVNLTQNTTFDDHWSVSSHGSSFGYFLSHTDDYIYITWIYSKFRWAFSNSMYVYVYRYDLDFANSTKTYSTEKKKDMNGQYPDYYWGKYYGNINGSVSTNSYSPTLNSSWSKISNTTYENGVLFDIGGKTFFASDTGYYGEFDRTTKTFSDVVNLGISVVSATNNETKIPVATNSGAIYVLEYK